MTGIVVKSKSYVVLHQIINDESVTMWTCVPIATSFCPVLDLHHVASV